MVLHFTNRPTENSVMPQSSVNREGVCSYISLISSVAFMNLSGCYAEDVLTFKNLLVPLVNNFPGCGKRFKSIGCTSSSSSQATITIERSGRIDSKRYLFIVRIIIFNKTAGLYNYCIAERSHLKSGQMSSLLKYKLFAVVNIDIADFRMVNFKSLQIIEGL